MTAMITAQNKWRRGEIVPADDLYGTIDRKEEPFTVEFKNLAGDLFEHAAILKIREQALTLT